MPTVSHLREELLTVYHYEKRVLHRALADAWAHVVGHSMGALMVIALPLAFNIAILYTWMGPDVAWDNARLGIATVGGVVITLVLALICFLIRTPARLDEEKDAAHAEELAKVRAEHAKDRESDLPAIRPKVVAARYGKIVSGPEAGYTGIALRNDGEPAYSVSPVSPVDIPGVGRLEIWGTVLDLRQNEPEIHFPVSRETPDGGTLGSGLYDFMVKHDLDTLTVPFTYHDGNGGWWQTDIVLIKDQMARSVAGSEGGIRVGFEQKKLPRRP